MRINDLKGMFKAKVRPLINFIKKIILIKKYYPYGKLVGTPETVFIVDGNLNHGGLTDRLNGIISTYAICRIHNIPFRIKWDYPFSLQSYLVPNTYNWIMDEDDRFVRNSTSKVVIVLNDPKSRALYRIKKNRQNHVYANMNILPHIKEKYKVETDWHSLFNELFKPNEILEKNIIKNTLRIGTEYIGIVFRFQQLLGDFKEGSYPTLAQQEQKALISKCIDSVKGIKLKHPEYNFLVTSDSITFLNIIAKESRVYIIPGKVVHMLFSVGEEYSAYLKSFVDFFMLSKAKKVYSVIASEMKIDGHLFLTTFPEYAAKAGGAEFERVYI